MPNLSYPQVATVLCQQLGYYVDLQKNSKDQKAVLKQALPWVNRANSFISSNCAKKPDTIWQIYNVGQCYQNHFGFKAAMLTCIKRNESN